MIAVQDAVCEAALTGAADRKAHSETIIAQMDGEVEDGKKLHAENKVLAASLTSQSGAVVFQAAAAAKEEALTKQRAEVMENLKSQKDSQGGEYIMQLEHKAELCSRVQYDWILIWSASQSWQEWDPAVGSNNNMKAAAYLGHSALVYVRQDNSILYGFDVNQE